MNYRVRIARLCGVAILTAGTHAATLTWTNVNGGNWSLPANWSPNQVPTAEDAAVITTGGTYTVTLDNTATISALTLGGNSGRQTLRVASQTLTINGASTINPNGVLDHAGGRVVAGGGLSMNGALVWRSGFVEGTINIGANGALDLDTSGVKELLGTISNLGTTRWLGGTFYLEQASLFHNRPGGTFVIQTDDLLQSFGATPNRFVNEGVLRKAGSSGTTVVLPEFSNRGAVEVQSGSLTFPNGFVSSGSFTISEGARLQMQGGVFALEPGTIFSGAGFYGVEGNTVTIIGDLAALNFQLRNGTLESTNRITGSVQWTGTLLRGKFTVAEGGTLTLGAPTFTFELFGSITNAGTVNLAQNGTLYLEDESTFHNLPGGTVNISADTSITTFGREPNRFINEGRIRKFGGTGTVAVNVDFINRGVVEVESGILGFPDGFVSSGQFTVEAGARLSLQRGVFSFEAGHMLTGEGFYGLDANEVTILGDIASPNFQLRAGALIGTNRITGTAHWAGAILRGKFTVAAGGTLSLDPPAGAHELFGSITNGGTVAWLSSGTLYLEEGSTFHNLPGALLDMKTDGSLASFGTGPNVFVNEGTVRRSVTTGANTVSVEFMNRGLLEMLSGRLHFTEPFVQSAGSTLLQGGSLSAAKGMDFQGGTVGGAGTISANVNNSGLISPGSTTAGRLRVEGDYAQKAGGRLHVDLGGLPEDSFDQLFVTGEATLDGSLDTGLISGFVPPINSTFRFLTAGTVKGQFASHAFPANQLDLQVTYTTADATIKVVNVSTVVSRFPPVLAAIADQRVDELGTVKFTATATDADVPANILSYRLEGAPVGATINASTGEFTWTPTEAQGPGSYNITVRVTDNGALSDAKSFVVTVRELNQAPTLLPIESHVVAAGKTLAFRISATDPDLPPQNLTFSLAAGAPPGASITANGDFTWNVPAAQPEGTNSFTVRVSDDFNPPASASRQFFVEVDRTAPRIMSMSPTGQVSRVVDRTDLTFDSAINPASVGIEDVSLSGASGPVQVFTQVTAENRVALYFNALAAGDYALTVGPNITDVGGNNMVPFSGQFTVGLADLQVVSIVVPTQGSIGEPIEVIWTLTNKGNVTATGPWMDSILFKDQAGEQLLATYLHAGVLHVKESLVVTQSLLLPAGVSGQRIIAIRTDANGEVSEGANESNNETVATSAVNVLAPDLIATIEAAPAAARFGRSVEVTWTVKNVGTSVAEGIWDDALYLSTAANSASGPVLVVRAGQRGLAPGASYTRRETVTLPLNAGLTEGQYSFVVATDLYGTQPEGNKQNNLAAKAVSLTRPPLPNLSVRNITAPAIAAGGRSISLSWDTQNTGNATATSGWAEAIYLADAPGGGSEQWLDSITVGADLAAGASARRTVQIPLPPFATGNRWLVIRADSANSVFETDENDNTGISATPMNLAKSLTISLSVDSVPENAPSNSVQVLVTRNGTLEEAASVQLISSDISRFRVPASAVIPAGSASVALPAAPIDDGLVNSDAAVLLTGSASGFENGSATINVLNDDKAALALELASTNLTEAASTTVQVSRNTSTAAALNVSLTSSDSSRLRVPLSVTIPAGARTASFSADALNNDTPNLPLSISIAAAAPGHGSTSGALTIADDDTPTLTLSSRDTTITEAAENPATIATLTRSPVNASELRISLRADDPLIIAGEIIIPGSIASVTIPVQVRNDTSASGVRTARLEARVLDPTSGSPLPQPVAATQLTITDDDSPSLFLELDRDVIAESGTATAVVRRNSAPASALTVNLASTDITEASVPASVTIPANQSAASFVVTGRADGITDGAQRVTIVASVAGLNPGQASLTVSDLDLPDLRVTSIRVPEAAIAGEDVTITWTVRNEGQKAASGGWSDNVFIARAGSSEFQPAGSVFHGPLLAPGAEYSGAASITAPDAPGSYNIIVIADAENAVLEVLAENNTLVSAAFDLAPPYQAFAETDVTLAPSGAAVPIKGRAVRTSNGAPAPFVFVQVNVRVQSTRRTLDAITDKDGNFTATFQSLAGEAGGYTIGAAHPQAPDTDQDQFELVGVSFDPSEIELRLFPGVPLTTKVRLENIGDLPLARLSATVTNPVAALNVSTKLADAVAPHGFVDVEITFDPAPAVPAQRAVLLLEVASAEGAKDTLPIRLNIAPQRATLVATPGILERGVTRGKQVQMEFMLANTGGGGSGPLEVRLPDVPWLKLSSPVHPEPLGPGESTKVTLLANPPADLPLTRYDGTLNIVGTGVQLAVPFSLRALSEARGDLRVEVQDEFTFYADGAPRLAGAQVRLFDALTGDPVVEGTSGADGFVLFTNLVEATYLLEVTADKHSQFKASGLVAAGKRTDVVAFLDRLTVAYRWNVVPVEIEDSYRVVLQSEFETEVPFPVVTIDNPFIMPVVIRGEDTQFEVRLTNHGLIAAENVGLRIPDDPNFEFETLVDVIPVLPAKSSVSIPVIIRHRSEAAAPAQTLRKQAQNERRLGRQGAPRTSFTGCEATKLSIEWSIRCGPGNRSHSDGITVKAVPVEPDCVGDVLLSIGLAGLGHAQIKRDLIDLITGRNFYADPVPKIKPPNPCSVIGALAGCASGGDKCVSAIAKGLCSVGTGNAFGAITAAISGFANCVCPVADASTFGAHEILAGYTLGADFEVLGGSGGFGALNMPTGGWGGGPCPPASASARPGLHALSTGGESGVCARVRLEIVQEAVVTRAAFLGTLEIDNGNTETTLEDIQVILDIRDTSGAAANSKFGVRPPELSGLTGVDGAGMLGPGAAGSAKFTIIPNRDAAPEGPVGYRIGGTLRYREGNAVVEVPLLPDTITVYPDPVLNLIYFQQRDVFSDNPFTDEIEPSEPFVLGLLVKNTGKGDARRFRITSAQPRIIENEKGLLIDFKIIGTQVGDTALAPTLTADLGSIPAGQSKVATWQLLSTLEGKFIDYEATFEQQNSLGDPRLSLIDHVEIHELIHAVKAEDDAVTDFLVNDLPDAENSPDTLYLSSGGILPVNLALRPAIEQVQGAEMARLTASMNSGWNYLRIVDPSGGLRLIGAKRSDGKTIRVGDNIWQTDRTFVAGVAGPRRERMIHLLDFEGPGDYTLYFRATDAPPIEIASLQEPLPFVQTAPIESLDVTFTEVIDAPSFTGDDLRLIRNGAPVSLEAAIQSLDGTRFRISGLTSSTSDDGSYELTVSGAGVFDPAGAAVANSRSVSWAKGSVAPVVASLGPVSPAARTTPVSSVNVAFSSPIDAASFTAADLTLLRNGVSLPSVGVIVAPTSISGLEPLNSVDGEYQLTVNAAGVSANSIGGAGEKWVTWIVDTTGPTIAELEEIRTTPRNIVVDSLVVTFSEPVKPEGFTLANLKLTRKGGANLITPAVTLQPITPSSWRIANLGLVSGQAGSYELTVSAQGLRDNLGNPGLGTATRSWLLDTTTPTPPAGLTLLPGSRSASFRLTLQGALAEPGLLVDIADLTTGANLGLASVAGTSFSRELNLETAGAHQLRVRAVDPAGNVSADALIEAFIDRVPPSASLQDVTPDIRTDAVNSLDVTFSEGINPASFTTGDVTLRRDDQSVALGGVSIVPLSATSARISGLGPLTAAPGSYSLALNVAGISDMAGNAGQQIATRTWLRKGANTAPQLAAITDRRVSPETLVIITNKATDLDKPGDQITFTLGPGAPTGAAITPSGVFSWRPSRQQANTAPRITVIVTDNGTPSLSDSKSFTVTVEDFAELTFGSVAVQAGTRGKLPIQFSASAPCTEVIFTIAPLDARLSGPVVLALEPATVSALLEPQTNGELLLTFTAAPGTSLPVDQTIGFIELGAAAGLRTAFIPVVPLIMTAKAGARDLPNTRTVAGRVIGIAGEPILDIPSLAEGNLILRAYGRAGTSWLLQQQSALSPSWSDVVTLSADDTLNMNSTQPVPNGVQFFRLIAPE